MTVIQRRYPMSLRAERRRTGITARQQRIRKRRLLGLTDRADARRYAAIQRRCFGLGPGHVRERCNVQLLTRAETRFVRRYIAKHDEGAAAQVDSFFQAYGSGL